MAGRDTIENNANQASISGSEVIISIDGAGTGDDTVYNSYYSSKGLVYVYRAGEGNNSIGNFGAFDTPVVTGANVTINTGAGLDRIQNYGNNVSINAVTGNDYVYNDGGSKVMIRGGDGDDTITGYGDNVSILGGAGNDTLTGGKGEDTFICSGGQESYHQRRDAHIHCLRRRLLKRFKSRRQGGIFYGNFVKNFLPIRQENFGQARIATNIRIKGARKIWQ